LADNQNIFWVDIGYKFVDAEGLIPRDIMPDYLHLTAKGYQIWAESIEPQLAAIIDGKASTTGASEADGEWTWSMEGPNGQMVEGILILKAEGNKLTGKLSRGENRWLEIENGQVNAQQVQWSVKRDRPDGSTMTYEIKGRCENGKITAQVTTTMDSQTVSRDWNARKK
jgi:hypothetical protein